MALLRRLAALALLVAAAIGIFHVLAGMRAGTVRPGLVLMTGLLAIGVQVAAHQLVIHGLARGGRRRAAVAAVSALLATTLFAGGAGVLADLMITHRQMMMTGTGGAMLTVAVLLLYTAFLVLASHRTERVGRGPAILSTLPILAVLGWAGWRIASGPGFAAIPAILADGSGADRLALACVALMTIGLVAQGARQLLKRQVTPDLPSGLPAPSYRDGGVYVPESGWDGSGDGGDGSCD
ncbi:hypothetical protein [Tistrella mobilis]|uniref:Uncharacterized protein n=1 Tax=Tistrella mobilis (strain KA081020-065) TaxID=1110502 RepID=I3TTF7_TISMK|nr:hypothetical protein [Tistrella mobilis]AFK56045.1 hypothetical protein TMO_b0037 [Tistrella mobilis KA081020-065]